MFDYTGTMAHQHAKTAELNKDRNGPKVSSFQSNKVIKASKKSLRNKCTYLTPCMARLLALIPTLTMLIVRKDRG